MKKKPLVHLLSYKASILLCIIQFEFLFCSCHDALFFKLAKGQRLDLSIQNSPYHFCVAPDFSVTLRLQLYPAHACTSREMGVGICICDPNFFE